MKPTVRVSIGGRAFNLEEDAYQVLENYLRSLRRHFMGNTEADEIISDIETRLSELLQMRIVGNDGVVSIDDAKEITKIMGNPKDFDYALADENTQNGSEPKTDFSQKYSLDNFKKKLYRDVENKVLGGVCGGLGHYFRVDPTAIRLLFTGLFLLLFITINWNPICTTIILIYIILWIITPPALSFKQKLEMTGDDPSIENIEDRTQPSPRKYKGTSVSTFFRVLLNIIVGFIAVIALLTIILMSIVFIWLYFDTEIVGLTNFLILLGYNTWNFKIAVLLVTIIPVATIFALMVKVLRRSSFTTQSLVSFIIVLVVWLCAAFYWGNNSFKFAHSHRKQEVAIESTTVNTEAKALYVNLDEEYLKADMQPNVPAFFYTGEEMKDRKICILPQIRIQEDTTLAEYKVEIHKTGYGKNSVAARRQAESLHLNYNISDSLITIKPKWYSNDDTWGGEHFELVVTKPKDKHVVIKSPLRESYNMIITGYGCYNTFFDDFYINFN